MTAPVATPETPRRGRVPAFLVLVSGLLCLTGMSFSDGADVGHLPPDNTLYTSQNWLQVAAVIVGAVLLLLPRVTLATKWMAGGVALVSSGLLLGSSAVAVKHWRPASGLTSGFGHIEEMQKLSLGIAVWAAIGGIAVLAWLYRTSALPVTTRNSDRILSLSAGAVVIVVVPLLVGAGSSDTMDARSLGAFALIYSLPWGVAFMLSAFTNRATATGVLAAVITSGACSIFLAPMPVLVDGTAAVAGVCVIVIGTALLGVRLRGALDPVAVA